MGMESLQRNRIDKKNGVVYTPFDLALFIANNIIKYFNVKKANINIFDPSLGNGVLIEAIVLLLKEKYKEAVNINVYGIDINIDEIEKAKIRLSNHLPLENIHFFNQDFFDFVMTSKMKFDIIISNPPYVRTQLLTTETLNKIKKITELSGKIDLYHAFMILLQNVLDLNGCIGIITSNSFLTNKTGTVLRKKLLQQYDIKEIFDLGDTKLFNAAVLPVVLILKTNTKTNNIVPFTSIYETFKKGAINIDNIYKALNQKQVISYKNKNYEIEKGVLNTEYTDLWLLANDETIDFNKQVKSHTWHKFSDVAIIKVGIKTCADNVFIKESFVDHQSEFELLRPLYTHHVLKKYKTNNTKDLYGIIYPHEYINNKTKSVNIELFPKTKKYLEQHYTQLTNRSYLIKAKRNWYEIWVPQNASMWKEPKIIFPDISEKPIFSLDYSGTIVNGDCYWLTLREEFTKCQDLLFLILAIANSSFIEKFYDINCQNKIYAGRRRFVTQYVDNFPIPNPQHDITKKIISIMKNYYFSSDNDFKEEEYLENLVWQSFGLKKITW